MQWETTELLMTIDDRHVSQMQLKLELSQLVNPSRVFLPEPVLFKVFDPGLLDIFCRGFYGDAGIT